MKVPKIKTIAFTRASNGKFVNTFGEIIQALIANQSVFADLPYTQQQLDERLRQITEKTNTAKEGSKAQKNERDQERTVCEQILFHLQAAVLKRASQEATYEAKRTIATLM